MWSKLASAGLSVGGKKKGAKKLPLLPSTIASFLGGKKAKGKPKPNVNVNKFLGK